jgi:hypothetical protein
MTLFRQVSWLADHRPSSPSQALIHKAQWQLEKGLTADSCGSSFGFGLSSEHDKPHRIPSWLVNATSTPELDHRNPARAFCQWRKLYFVGRCDISSRVPYHEIVLGAEAAE